MNRLVCTVIVLVALGGAASAQPSADPAPPADPPADPPPGQPEGPPGQPVPEEVEVQPEPLADPAPPPTPPILPVLPPTPTVHPEMFRAPSGRLLPAGHIYSRSGIDTGGGLSSGMRLGLGDVAEFGIELTDLVRKRSSADADPERIFPYGAASFKMGVAEDLLFANQPALSLGFRKSFERDDDGTTTRFAELYLAASKSLGQRTHLHLGVSVWDAVIDNGTEREFLHDGRAREQVKAFGGVEVEPLPDSSILLEVSWSPEFIYDQPAIELTPMFTWGERYSVADWLALESGVRIPDIRDADLLGAQIFGQVKFISRSLERMMKRGK